VNFWNARLWDAEGLAAYGRAIRVAAQVERVILEGRPYLPEVLGRGRAGGMRLDEEAVLLAADYAGEARGRVRLRIDLPRATRVIDLDRQTQLASLPAGASEFEVEVAPGAARPLHLQPVPTNGAR